MTQFHEVMCAYEKPSFEGFDAKYVRMGIGGQFAEGSELFVTKAMVSDEDRAYADGDSAGWEWDGAAHNSASRET